VFEVIEKVVKIVPMRQPSSDYAYWCSRPVQERIDTLEMLRQQYIEFGKDADPGLQRILRVVKPKSGCI
jgi:hypothetical protein